MIRKNAIMEKKAKLISQIRQSTGIKRNREIAAVKGGSMAQSRQKS